MQANGNDTRDTGKIDASSKKQSVPLQTLEERLDPVAARVRAELAADGINLDELLNAGNVVNLSRKLDALSIELEAAGAGAGQELLAKVDAIEKKLAVEKRQVMQGWLKKLFLGQALAFIVAGGLLSNNVVPFVDNVPLVGQALGFWSTWLFTIPALRARKGTSKAEKSALNIAFIATPLLNVAMPFATKNCGAIWAADVGLLAVVYVYFGALFTATSSSANDDDDDNDSTGTPLKEKSRIAGALKYLDWGAWR
jgi:hypothetical protein